MSFIGLCSRERNACRQSKGKAALLSSQLQAIMDSYDAEKAAELKKRRTFRKFSYRGHELDALLDMSTEDFMKIVHARARRRFSRGLKRKPMGLIKKLRKAKKEAPANEKPAVVRTHLRDMLVVPEMCGSQIGIYNGKVFNTVDIRPEMIGHYLGEYPLVKTCLQHVHRACCAIISQTRSDTLFSR